MFSFYNIALFSGLSIHDWPVNVYAIYLLHHTWIWTRINNKKDLIIVSVRDIDVNEDFFWKILYSKIYSYLLPLGIKY
jgi:hypothetical protein